jgi:cardiolipin synthase (CMP-forming)
MTSLAPRSSMARFRFLPNALTVARIGLAAAFPLADADPRVALLLAALATEGLDGFLARRYGWTTRLGRMLDPVADRVLFASVAITLLVEGRLSGWMALLLGARDLLFVQGVAVMAMRGRWRPLGRMKPRASGKVTTALQYAALFCLVVDLPPPWPLAIAAFVCGIVAAIQYYCDARRLWPAHEVTDAARPDPGQAPVDGPASAAPRFARDAAARRSDGSVA